MAAGFGLKAQQAMGQPSSLYYLQSKNLTAICKLKDKTLQIALILKKGISNEKFSLGDDRFYFFADRLFLNCIQ